MCLRLGVEIHGCSYLSKGIFANLNREAERGLFVADTSIYPTLKRCKDRATQIVGLTFGGYVRPYTVTLFKGLPLNEVKLHGLDSTHTRGSHAEELCPVESSQESTRPPPHPASNKQYCVQKQIRQIHGSIIFQHAHSGFLSHSLRIQIKYNMNMLCRVMEMVEEVMERMRECDECIYSSTFTGRKSLPQESKKQIHPPICTVREK